MSAQLVVIENKGFLTSVLLAKGQIYINHLCFANDSLLFCQAYIQERAALNQILGVYDFGFS